MSSNYLNTNFNKEKSDKYPRRNQKILYQSLALIAGLDITADDSIIDIGGGESHLIDHLVDAEFKEVTVLDISSENLEKMKIRIGKKSQYLKFIVSNILNFIPQKKYKLWHDVTTFKFLNRIEDVESYLQ